MNNPKVVRLPNVAPAKFLKEVVSELKKVTWPTRAETIRLTLTVIGISVLVGLFVGGLDAGLVKISGIILNK